MFDAYTVKKVLPRLVAAVVLIQLSWFIFTTMIAFSNIVAYGLEALMAAPFGGIQELQLDSIIGSTQAGGTAFTFVGLAAVGVVGFMAGFIAVFVIFSLITGFLVLAIRRVLLIALLLLSPLALVAWILPGTQRFWKMWWDNFSKLLIMFPIILVMITAGAIMAKVVAEQTGNNQGPVDPVGIVLALAAFFAPYFLIPQTYKAAGAGLALAAGWIGGKMSTGEGFFQKQRGDRRGKRWQDRAHRAREDNFFRGGNETNRRGKVNKLLAGAAAIPQAGLSPRRMRTKMRNAMRSEADISAEKFAKESASFGLWSGDDAKVWAAAYTSEADIGAELARRDAGRFGGEANRARREEAIAQIQGSQRETSFEAFNRARLLAQASTGTGYQYDQAVLDADGNQVLDADGNAVTQTVFDSNRMLDDINSVYGSDRNGAGRAMAKMRGALLQSGQVAGAAGFGTWADSLEGRYRNTMTEQDAHERIMNDAVDSATPGQAIYGKPSSAAAMGATHARRIQGLAANLTAARSGGDPAAIAQAEQGLAAAVASAAGVRDAMGQASPNNASAYARELMGAQLDIEFTGPQGTIEGGTIQQFIDGQMAGNSAFVERRKDIAQSTLDTARREREAAAFAAQNPTVPGAGGAPPTGPQMGPPPPPV